MAESTPTSTPTPFWALSKKDYILQVRQKARIFCNVKTIGKNDFIRPTFFIGVPLPSQTMLNFKRAFFGPLYYEILPYVNVLTLKYLTIEDIHHSARHQCRRLRCVRRRQR